MSGFAELLDELRCWETERLQRERARVIREKRRLEARELALTKVLDERRAVPKDQPARDGESEATARRKRETAEKLANLPHLGDAALNGELSSEQLHPAADLADEDSDEEWSRRREEGVAGGSAAHGPEAAGDDARGVDGAAGATVVAEMA